MRLAVNAGVDPGGRRPARARALPRAHGVQRHRELQAGRAGVASSNRSARASARTSTPTTSFDETIYMLDVPTDRPGYVDRGLTGAARLRRRHVAAARRRSKRSAASCIEEWRGRLGAGSRLTDKQLPVIFQGSRYAERLPIGLPEILKSFPRAAARRLLPEAGIAPIRWRWSSSATSTSGRGRAAGRRSSSAAIPAANGPLAAGRSQRAARTRRRWSTCRPIRKRRAGRCRSRSSGKVEIETTVGDYRKLAHRSSSRRRC